MKIVAVLLFAGIFGVGCHQPGSVRSPKPEDSAQIVQLLKDVYRWHDKSQAASSDFSIIVKDSFQVGVNFDSLRSTLDTLKRTNYFSAGFIANYKHLADQINTRLSTANPKLLNEINFSFQDADPWTGFQDSEPAYWDTFTIVDYKATADSASLKWKIKTADWASDPYAVGFAFENGQWRVAYLEGFADTTILK